MNQQIPEMIRPGCVMISARGSGHGKSVVTMGLLQALKERRIPVRSFKCGPDYIDPGFHERVLGIPCRNLDTYLMGEGEVAEEVEDAHSSGSLVAAEGAMGLYDGLGGRVEHSAYAIACLCRMPVLAVLDDGREDGDCTAQLISLLERDGGKRIRGILVNRCPKERYAGICRDLEEAIRRFGRRILLCGFLPPVPEAVFPSRHLGLVGAKEAQDFGARVHAVAAALEEGGAVEAVLDLMSAPGKEKHAHVPGTDPAKAKKKDAEEARGAKYRCRIAVARDAAFSFVYQRALENLERAGACLCFFSPLEDPCLPEGAGGLLLPGGYPELYAKALERNASMRLTVKEAVQSGMPTVAECGGFLYLGEKLYTEEGRGYRMAGALPGEAARQEKLVRFGYLELAQERGDSLLLRQGETVHAHEFHYWDSTSCGEDLLARKRSAGRTWRCAYARPNLYAAFPHLYLDKVRAERFAAACEGFLR